MLLGIPISTDSVTFSWPFIHRIYSPGIYDLDPAFISNITIIKGGDQQQISYKQRLGIVDIRIDFGSLFSTMLATKGDPRNRPTLKRYLQGISGEDSYKKGVVNFSIERESETTKQDTKKTLTSTSIELEPNLDSIKSSMEDMKPELNGISAAIQGIGDKIKGIASGIYKIGDKINNPILRGVVYTIAAKVGSKTSAIGTTVGNMSNITESITNLDVTSPLTFGKEMANISDEMISSADTLKNDVAVDLDSEANSLGNISTQVGTNISEEIRHDLVIKQIELEETADESEAEALKLETTAGETEDLTPKTKQQTTNRVNTATKAKSEDLIKKSPL